MDSLTILLLNAILYTITVSFFVCRMKAFNLGIFIYCIYTIAGWASFLFYQQPLFRFSEHNSTITIEPFLYLYIVLLLFTYPFVVTRMQYKNIECRSIGNFNFLVKIIFCFQIFTILLLLPDTIRVLLSGNSMLAENRDAVYSSDADVLWFTSKSVFNIPYLFNMGLLPIAVALSVYKIIYLKQRDLQSKLFLFSTILCKVCESIVLVNRGDLIIYTLYYISLLIFFKRLINQKTKRNIYIFLMFSTVLFGFLFWIISIARFEDLAYFMLYKYAGESFINFNGLMYHNLKASTDGSVYFALFRRVIGLGSTWSDTREKWDYILKMTGVSGQYFYTFIGGLCFEFGKLKTLFIAIIFNILGMRLFVHTKEYSLASFLIFAIGGYVFIAGVFLFPLQGMNGNLTIMFTVMLYFYFKNNKRFI